ncbi:MAG: C4-dicarboxylate TRAP transporter substrate-binding protein [Lachnospiraceae bacterium]|nr:C4-dicarboxylate TRAP transporter substrate-binding protein [Lachnospiraceae bacterium]
MKKRFLAMMIAAMMAVSLMACGGSSGSTTSTTDSSSESEEESTEEASTAQESSGETVVLQIGFENSSSEPIGQALQKWKELVDEQGDGSLVLELYPDSQLGSKSELLDGMLLGETYVTLCDGSFYAEYGVPDFSVMYAPFLFDDWDQVWTLVESDWYADMCSQLADNGLTIVSSNWAYGARHTLTTTPVNTVDDLEGLKIRVPSNTIQSLSFDVLGAASVGMDLGDVYTALQQGTIDGAENPIATLYGRNLHEVAKYLILDGHVLNSTTWVMSTDVFNSLTEEQQELLISTGEEAGLYNNTLLEESEDEYLQLMIDEGVTVVEPSEEVLEGFKEKAEAIWDYADEFGWSDGLYETVKEAMGAE